MEFKVKLDGGDEHWTMCPGRAVIDVSVRWRPAEEPAGDPGPHCGLSYLTTPGSLPGALPATITLRREDNEPGVWVGHTTFEAPPFSPLRVRVELRPAFQRPQVAVLHVIPKTSAWIASGLVAASLSLAAILLAMTLATLRMTLLQAATQLSSIGLLGAALFVLQRALAALRPDHLPFLGVTYLIHRSALACTVGFLALFAALQSCFVVIHNDTSESVALNLPWLNGATALPPNARISVMPQTVGILRTDLLSYLDPASGHLPLCVDDLDDPAEQKTPCLDDAPYVRPTLRTRLFEWFTPPTLRVRCGRRWPSLTRERVVGEVPRAVEFEGDAVWITPEGPGCDERPKLWYRHDDGGVHNVRFPWEPQQLAGDDTSRLFVARVAVAQPVQPLGLTLVTRHDESETRIALSAGHADEGRGFALVGNNKEDRLALQIGDALPRITDPFAPTATLACLHGPGSRVFQATQLALAGPNGWLVGLSTDSPQGLSWTSKWDLVHGSSLAVAAPWMCEALPGDDPSYSKRIAFAPDRLTLVVDEDAQEPRGQALVLPAHLMSRRVEVKRRRPDKPEFESVGHLDCGLKVAEDEHIVVGAVQFDDRRDGKFRDFTVVTDQKEELQWRPEERPESGHKAVAWLCWRHGANKAEVQVTRGGEERTHAIKGSWAFSEATLTLEPKGVLTCYLDAAAPLTPIYDLKGYRKVRAKADAEASQKLPAFRHCDAVWTVEKKKEAP